jgi:hypothetical protein
MSVKNARMSLHEIVKCVTDFINYTGSI